MATVREILGKDTDKIEYEFFEQGFSFEEVREKMINLAKLTKQKKEFKEKYGSIAGDGVIPSIKRGFKSNVGRVKSFYNGLAKGTSFDLTTKKEDKDNALMLEDMESIKQQTSRQHLSKERLEELKKLDTKNANAQGAWQNIKAGANTMVDTLTHPSEWTTQGVVEMLSDVKRSAKMSRQKLKKVTL